MKEVTVDTAELLEKLRSNRKKHIEEFRRAIVGWQEAAVRELRKAAQKIKKAELSETTEESKFPQINLSDTYDRPRCYVKDYDRAIAMLEMHKEGTIKIATKEFDQFVNDEWAWKEAFTMSNSKYGVV